MKERSEWPRKGKWTRSSQCHEGVIVCTCKLSGGEITHVSHLLCELELLSHMLSHAKRASLRKEILVCNRPER